MNLTCKYIVGVDVGSSKIYAAAGKIDENEKLQIAGITSYDCIGTKNSIVTNVDSTANSIDKCIKHLEEMIGTEIKDVYISVQGGMYSLIKNKGITAISNEDHEVTESEVSKAIESSEKISLSAGKKIIGSVPVKYSVDGYEYSKEPLGKVGLKLEIESQVIIVQSETINNLLNSFNKAGLKVNGLVLEPIAEAEVTLNAEEKKLGTVIIDVGAEITTVSFLKNQNLYYSFSIPYGGSTITNDISICLNISKEKAEKIKRRYGNVKYISKESDVKLNLTDKDSISYKTLSEIISARTEEICELIKHRLEKNRNFSLISSVIIAGGGISFIKGIKSQYRDILNRDVKIASIEQADTITPVYASCIGIVKNAFEMLKYNYNLNTSKKELKNENGIIKKIKNFISDFF